MSVDPASFKTRFSEFVSVADARIQVFIDDSEIIINETYWGTKYDLGISYLTAHFLILAQKSEAGSTTPLSGAVTGRSVDGTSVNYASPPTPDNQNEAYYSQTVYGQRYLALRKTLGIPAFSV